MNVIDRTIPIEAPLDAGELVPAEVPVETHGLPLPPGKPPWNPKSFTGLAFVFSFAAAGLLAGLNWRRLGQSERTWPTLLLSLMGLAGLIAVLVLLPSDDSSMRLVAFGVNIGFGALLARWQASAYRQWVATYGPPTARQSGYLIPTGVCLGFLALLIALMFIPLVGVGLLALAVLVALIGWLASLRRSLPGEVVQRPRVTETTVTAEPVAARPEVLEAIPTLVVYGAGLVLACFSPAFYYHVARRRVAQAAGFFLLFGLLLTVLQAATLTIGLNTIRTEVDHLFATGVFPEITISHGQATIHGSEPVALFDQDRHLLVLDTTGHYQPATLASGNYDQGFLLTRTALVNYDSEEGQLQTLELSDLQGLLGDPFEITAPAVQRWISGFQIVAVMALAVWNTLIRLIYLAPLALLMWGLAGLVRRGTSFSTVLITGLYALVPACYARFVFAQVSADFFGLFTLLLLPGWTLGLVAALMPRSGAHSPSSLVDCLTSECPLRPWRALLGLPLLLDLGLEAVFGWNAWYVTWPLVVATFIALLVVSLWPVNKKCGQFRPVIVSPVHPINHNHE